jgi:SAM-dependent methyltransferase
MHNILKFTQKPEFHHAQQYHEHAYAQKKIAQHFFAYLKNNIQLNLNTEQAIHIIELGCGTGLFSALFYELYKEIINAKFTLVDNCQNMLDNCRKNLNTTSATVNNYNYILGDAEYINYTDMNNNNNNIGTDLQNLPIVLSSMCMQWFENIPRYIERNIKKCQYIAFTVPTTHSFKNWQNMHSELGMVCPLHQLIATEQIENYPHIVDVQYITVPIYFKNVLDFMRHFKQLGAYIKKTHYQVADIRRLVALHCHINNYQADFNTHYHVAMVVCRY